LQPFVNKKWWINGLYVCGIAFSMLGLLQFAFFPSLKPLISLGWDEHYGRLFGTLFDPNFMGMVLVLAFVLGFYFIFSFHKGKTYIHHSFIWFTQAILLLSIILTYSRSTYLALLFALGYLTYSFKLYRFFFVLVLACIGVYLIIPKGSMDVNRLTREVSTTARFHNWQQSIDMFRERPILGYGFNLLRVRIQQEKQLDEYGVISRDASGVNSSILFVFITTGIIGGITYIWWIIHQFQTFRMSNDVVLGVLGGSSLFSALVFSFFNQGLFYPWISIWLFILFGIVLRKD
jgi:O-antigen ligase